jgi:regulator of replication initiation timing
MTDIQKLKALAVLAQEQNTSWIEAGRPWPIWNSCMYEMHSAANPAAVLELINERSIAILQLDIQRDIAARRHEKIEKLKAENERLELENEDTLKKYEEAVEGFTKLSAEVLELRQQLAVPSDVLADCEALRLENEALRRGMKGDYDLDAWLDWAKEASALREELRISDAIIAERGRLLDMFDCPEHGQCVPFAMDQVQAMRLEVERLRSAEKTLQHLGYTNNGGQLWKPSIGEKPDFNLLDQLKAESEALRLFTHACYPVSTEIDPRGHRWSEAYLDEALAVTRTVLVKGLDHD